MNALETKTGRRKPRPPRWAIDLRNEYLDWRTREGLDPTEAQWCRFERWERLLGRRCGWLLPLRHGDLGR
jgi:hypothetical protein